MSLDYILLGLLREPASGYDLKAAVDQGIGHFWAAELSQIYPALKQMEKRGWLRSRRAASKRGPARLVYEVTAEGRRQLVEWLQSGPQFGDSRHPFLGQLFVMDELDDLGRTLAFLETVRERWVARRAALQGVERAWARSDPGFPDRLSPAAFHQHLTLRMGLHSHEGWIAWCDESITRVRARALEEKRHGKSVSSTAVGAHRRGRVRADPVLDTGPRRQRR